MTSIERTAYPRFRREMTAQEFEVLSPLPEEIEWARERCRAEEHLFGLVLGLKCFQRLGYFPRDEQLPVEVIERVRTCLGLAEGTLPDAARRTAAWQRELIRERVGAVFDPERARALAEQAIRAEAEIKNHPPDLINVALELLVREGLELPGFSTLNEIAARVRAEINSGMFARILARMTQPEILRVNRIGWHLQFGPASGSDPKLRNPLVRYSVTTFTYGSRMGAAQAARHMRGIIGHELGATYIRHFTVEKLDRASVDVINEYLRLDITKAWGQARSVAADGTMVDTLLENLLAERHIRYGGYGGIAYHHVADNYIALFSHFIPCGVWEAVYIIEGLLKQRSAADPDTIHADTQGQSFPVHALAHLFGFELLTRIRNWKDRSFWRPDRETVYRHIEQLFGEPGQNVINWELIRAHWRDLMRIALSIREGRLSSTLLLRRLSSESRRNNVYRAFRELGRAICTIDTLLRLISEPELRAQIDAATNKVESYNNFTNQLAGVRLGADRAQRPRRAGEDDQVQHAARQLRDLPHRARHEQRRPRPARRGPSSRGRRPRDDGAVHHGDGQAVRRIPDRRTRAAARGV